MYDAPEDPDPDPDVPFPDELVLLTAGMTYAAVWVVARAATLPHIWLTVKLMLKEVLLVHQLTFVFPLVVAMQKLFGHDAELVNAFVVTLWLLQHYPAPVHEVLVQEVLLPADQEAGT